MRLARKLGVEEAVIRSSSFPIAMPAGGKGGNSEQKPKEVNPGDYRTYPYDSKNGLHSLNEPRIIVLSGVSLSGQVCWWKTLISSPPHQQIAKNQKDPPLLLAQKLWGGGNHKNMEIQPLGLPVKVGTTVLMWRSRAVTDTNDIWLPKVTSSPPTGSS